MRPSQKISSFIKSKAYRKVKSLNVLSLFFSLVVLDWDLKEDFIPILQDA